MRTLPILGAVLLTMSQPSVDPSALTPSRAPSQLSGVDRPTMSDESSNAQSEWRSLFDGKSLNGWRGYQMFRAPAGWSASDGVLSKRYPTEDLISADVFGDFELELEWKIGPGGNGGIFYRGTEEYDHVYWSAPEFQLLDDASAPDAKSRLTSAGAAYALYPSTPGKVRAAGQWNATRIICRGPHVEHWLNGTKIVEYELWSADWEAKVKASKFVEWKHFGRAKTGHIAIQGDHDGDLALRNIRIRELK
ncbi:MAG: DUF1080 domain-containing protein [Gemmatimonadaceae bacterium]